MGAIHSGYVVPYVAPSTTIKAAPTVVDSIVVGGDMYGTTYPAIYGTINCSKNRLELGRGRGFALSAYAPTRSG